MPLIDKHAIIIAVVGFVYAIVNLAYEKTTGEGVYTGLMWDNFGDGVHALFVFMGWLSGVVPAFFSAFFSVLIDARKSAL